MNLDKIMDWFDDNEDIAKMVCSTVLLLVGIAFIAFGISLEDVHAGFMFLFMIMGVPCACLGIAPIGAKWIYWHNM